MKSKIFAMTFALALSSSALAEVRAQRPGGGEIVDGACGLLNRSVTICIGQASKSKEFYLVYKVFAPRSVTYIPVTQKNTTRPGIVGSVSKDYIGRAAVEVAPGTMNENIYQLKTASAVVMNPKVRAQLFVNGVSAGPTIELEAVRHTQ